jgi:hypothetical protein
VNKPGATIHANHNPEGGAVSEIQSLSQSVRDFSQGVDRWNQLMLVGLALTVLAALFVLIATRMVVFRTGQLATAQELLGAAKDRQLAIDLRDKDLRIAEANRLAADANKATEDERTARVELEDKVAWRTFSKRQQKDIKTNLDQFAGQLAECNFLSGDTEAFSFSSEIAAALRAARWQVIPPNPYVIAMKETSLPNAASPIVNIDFGVEVVSTSDAPAITAAHAIAEELGKVGFDAYFKPSAQRPQASRVWITVQHRPLGAQGEAKLRGQKAKKQ